MKRHSETVAVSRQTDRHTCVRLTDTLIAILDTLQRRKYKLPVAVDDIVASSSHGAATSSSRLSCRA